MNLEVPVIILKNIIILPNQEIKIELNNIESSKVINEASNNYNNKILVVAPLDNLEENPGVEDLPKVGVIARIKSKISKDNITLVKLHGIKRVAINKYYQKNNEILYSEYMYIDLPNLVDSENKAIIKKLINTLKQYIESSPSISNDVISIIESTDNLNVITDAIASFLPFKINKKLEYMQEINPIHRAKSLIKDIEEEINLIALDNELEENIETSLQKKK